MQIELSGTTSTHNTQPFDHDDKSDHFHSFHFQIKVTELRIDLIAVNEQTKKQTKINMFAEGKLQLKFFCG